MMINDFESLKVAVRTAVNEQYDIENILRGITNVDSRGNAICPFHNDRKKGSFKYKKNINRFRCFSCGKEGDIIDLIQHQRNQNFVTTIYELGYELGLISLEEKNNKRIDIKNRKELNTDAGITIKKNTFNKVENKEIKVKATLTEEEIYLYDIVYRTFAHHCGLDNKDKQHLLEVRKINPNKLNDYFSIRSLEFKGAIDKTVQDLSKKGITEKHLIQVPGFAYTKAGNICLSSYVRGIGMKIRNSNGKVVGIQVRTESKDKKYLWLSSSNRNGKSSSTPPAIEYPNLVVEKGNLNKFRTLYNAGDALLLTEGKFKAEALSNKYNNVAIGIAGINNWKYKIKNEFLGIAQVKELNKIVVFADADCSYNTAIYTQFKALLDNELSNVQQEKYIACWNIEYGKGIDDVIHNGYDDKVKYYKLDEYDELYKKFLDAIDEFNTDDVNQNKELKIREYNRVFNI